MMWWKRVVIATITGAVAAVSGTYYLLNKRIDEIEKQMLLVTTLPTTLHHLSEQLSLLKELSFPAQPATLLYVNQLRDELAARITALDTRTVELNPILEKLTLQLQTLQKIPIPAHPASIEQLVELDKELKNMIATTQQTHLEFDGQLNAQVNDVRKIIASLLNTVKLKQEEMDKLVLPGTVIAYAGTIDLGMRQSLYQARWLICDGSELNKTSYSALYAAITDSYGNPTTTGVFKLPDFRGIFLRGLDSDKQIDPNRLLGSYQADQNQLHAHIGQAEQGGLHAHQGETDVGGLHRHRLQANGYWFTAKNLNERRAITNEVDDNQEYWTTEEGKHRHTFSIDMSGVHHHQLAIEASGGDESRPKNYPVTYLIRF